MKETLDQVEELRRKLPVPRVLVFECPDHEAHTEREVKKLSQSIQGNVQNYLHNSFEEFEEQLEQHSRSDMSAVVESVAVLAFLGHHSLREGFFFGPNADQPIPSDRFVKAVSRHGTFAQVDGSLVGGALECLVLSCCDTVEVGKQAVEAGVPVVLCWNGVVDDGAATEVGARPSCSCDPCVRYTPCVGELH